MGIVLFLAFMLGLLLGGGLSCAAGVVALVAASKRARRLPWPWPRFCLVLAVALASAWVAVALLPLEEARPGSDYELAARNLFLRGLGYALSPGLAALVALGASRAPRGDRSQSRAAPPPLSDRA